MKIAKCVASLVGTMHFAGVFWRSARSASDIYRSIAHRPTWLEPAGKDKYRMHSSFLEIHTDDGIVALWADQRGAGPMIIDTFKRLLVGQDPRAVERNLGLHVPHGCPRGGRLVE